MLAKWDMIDAFNIVVLLVIKWKKCHTARTVPKSNRKITETETKLIPLIYVYIHDSSINWHSRQALQ